MPPADDTWRFLINPRTVTLHVWRAEGDYVPQTVEGCNRSAVESVQLVDGALVLPVSECFWHLWRSKLAGAVPREPDVIEEGGERWVVFGVVNRFSHGARFRCRCRKEVGG